MRIGKYDSDAAVAGVAAGLRGQSNSAGDAGLRLQRLHELEKLVQSGAYHVDCVQLIENLLKKEPALFRPSGRSGSGKSSESF